MDFNFKIFIEGRNRTINLSLSDEELEIWFTHNWSKWMQTRIRREMRKGIDISSAAEIAGNEFKLNDLAQAPPDEIEEEAIRLAIEDIEIELAKDFLPPPRSIRDHAIMAIQSTDKYHERARQRLRARAEVVNETLGK